MYQDQRWEVPGTPGTRVPGYPGTRYPAYRVPGYSQTMTVIPGPWTLARGFSSPGWVGGRRREEGRKGEGGREKEAKTWIAGLSRDPHVT
eukprot:2239421-Rhodomonas_salina.6